MQNLISFLCLDNLLYQYLSVRFLSQIVKIEGKTLSAFVARHMALRHKSIRRHHFCLDDLTKEPEGGKLVDEVIRTKERNQILHLCMGELHPDYREALYLTYFEGMSYRQVAEVMGKSVKQITNIMYRGKERLRGLLEREGITNAES